MPEENSEDGDSMFFLNVGIKTQNITIYLNPKWKPENVHELFFRNFLLRFAMAIFYQLLQGNYLVLYVWAFHMHRQSKNSFDNPNPTNFSVLFLKTYIYIIYIYIYNILKFIKRKFRVGN